MLTIQSGLRRTLALCLAAVTAPVGAVVNGSVDGPPGRLQWPVGVFQADQLPPTLGGTTCSAFLIAPDWVLTAGNCVGNIAVGVNIAFAYVVDTDSCGGAGGQVSEAFIDPSNRVELVHLDHLCDLYFPRFILNDGAPPAVGKQLYDIGWGGGISAPLTGTTTVTDRSGIAADEIAFTGANLFCSGSNDDGGPHFDYGANGFPVAYAIFGYSDVGCAQYNVSVRVDTLIAFITSHVTQVCLSSNPTGPYCDGLFRDGMEAPLN
jgi:hypothetical protein